MKKKIPIETSCCSGSRVQNQDQLANEKTTNGEIEVKRAARERYGNIAKESNSNCGCAPQGLPDGQTMNEYTQSLGYSENDLLSIPLDANMGLGCGNPVALASIQSGETVVDLGSGGGVDCFLAANKVGDTGRVIGVDMTPSMIELSRVNLEKYKTKYPNVEFRLGEIEHLPVADNSVDVIISNCVINLSTDKGQVFKEAYRVLKPGGRLMISDIMIEEELPEIIQTSLDAYAGCVAGAMLKEEYFQTIRDAGFNSIDILQDNAAADFTQDLANERKKAGKKPKIVFGGKEIDHDFTEEEVKDLGQLIRSVNFSAIK